MTNREVPLIDKLKGWIESSGYSLELRVARAFQRRATLVDLAHLYVDPETGTQREIDVIAVWERRVPNGVLRVRITIECKTSKHPWIVFGNGRRRFKREASYTLRAASLPITPVLRHAGENGKLDGNTLLHSTSFVGATATEAFTQGTDHAFAAIMSAGKAALGAVHEANESFGITGALEICFPLVVLGGRLFECHLSDAGELVTEETTKAAVSWKRSPLPFLRKDPMASLLGIVDIVTEDGLAAFVEAAHGGALMLLEYLASQLEIHSQGTDDFSAERA
jgi:hypothetical protein